MKFFCRLFLIGLLVSSTVPYVSASDNADEEIFRALSDEMSRSLSELQLGSLERPYHIEYILTKRNRVGTHSVLGTTQDADSTPSVSVTVKVRVGTHRFDNTNFFDVSLGFFGSSDDEESFKNRRLPTELSYNTLRRELWLATDACYKQAVEVFAKKQAVVMNRSRSDTTWDFKPVEKATVNYLPDLRPTASLSSLKNYCDVLSKVLKDYPEIISSRVGMEFVPEETFYLSSDGRQSQKFESFAGVEVVAATQASDGMPAFNTYACYAQTLKELPSLDSLKRAVVTMAQSIRTELNSSTIEAYSGPVIFEGQAAGEVIAQAFAPNVVAQRQPMSDGGFSTGERNLAFQNKIGARVLPEFLSLSDMPLKTQENGVALAGHYVVDDEGMAAENVLLVDKGYLKTLLSSRVPTKRIQTSNGHQRGGGAMFSNVIMTCNESKKQLDAAGLKKRMLKLVKDRDLPYGIIVRRITNQNLLLTGLYAVAGPGMIQMRGENKLGALEIFRVFPDGREEQIRGVEIAGIAPATFKDILFVGKKPSVHNLLANSVLPSFITGGSQFTISSVVSPDLLFEDVEIRPLEGDLPKPPIMKSPLETAKN